MELMHAQCPLGGNACGVMHGAGCPAGGSLGPPLSPAAAPHGRLHRPPPRRAEQAHRVLYTFFYWRGTITFDWNPVRALRWAAALLR